MRVQGGLPGGAETLRIEPVDLHLQLVDVAARALLDQAMEQQALLHWRQAVEIVQFGQRYRQGIQAGLVDPRQGEIRRRRLHCALAAAVLDQRP
ncbi:hypothetical protein D3C84_615910 [compost metagenome]